MQTFRAIGLAAGLGVAGVAVPTASAIPGYTSCPSPPWVQYDVIGGVTCGDTWVAQFYDPAGEKYQQFADFTCYSATEDQRPVVLTCASGAGELVVSEVG